MSRYKVLYQGGRVEYVLAASLEAAQAYARSHLARLEEPAAAQAPPRAEPAAPAGRRAA